MVKKERPLWIEGLIFQILWHHHHPSNRYYKNLLRVHWHQPPFWWTLHCWSPSIVPKSPANYPTHPMPRSIFYLCDYKDVVGDNVKCLPKVKVNSIHCSFLFCWANLLIKSLSLVKAHYTGCSQPPSCPASAWKRLPGVFGQQSRDRAKADRPVGPWVVLLALLKVAAIQPTVTFLLYRAKRSD